MEKRNQKDILKWMLGRAYAAEKREKQLKERWKRIRQEMDAPYGAVRYDAMPRSQGCGDGAAAMVFKLEEVEEKLIEQIKIAADEKMYVMEIIAYIPPYDLKRQILELRHIDMRKWHEIAAEIPMSRQQCSRKYTEALEELLLHPEVQEKVNRAEPEYNARL